MDRYALITGASSGIGKALAFQFAENGYNLILVADHEEGLLATAHELANIRPHAQLITIVKDLTDPNGAVEIFNQLERKNVEIHALVNNAGVGQHGYFKDIELERDIYLIRLNIEAVTRLIKLFLPAMLRRGEGKILNVGSIAGFQPGPMLAVYHATKAYVVSLSEALAEELKDTNITVTCLCPGPTATRFFQRAEMEDARIIQQGHLMSANEVAEAAFEGLKHRERIVIPGATNKVLTFMRRVMPIALQAKLNKKFYEEVEER